MRPKFHSKYYQAVCVNYVRRSIEHSYRCVQLNQIIMKHNPRKDKKQKQLFICNLKAAVDEEDLSRPIGVRSINYLKEVSNMKMLVNQKKGRNKGFDFISALKHTNEVS